MEFRLLGPLEVVDDGQPVDVGGGRRRALLTLLLIHANEVVSADRLIDQLWGERPPPTAAKSIQVYVSQLRKVLRAASSGKHELLVTRGSGYVLEVDPEALDLRRFERLLDEAQQRLAADDPRRAVELLNEALALWRGPALYDFAYEDFAEAEAARLEELRLDAFEVRIDAELALGEQGRLVGELESLVREHPQRERFRSQLMLALYRCGRQSDALAVYRDGRRLLDEELGIEPSPELRELERQILNQSPQLAGPRRPRTAARGRDTAVAAQAAIRTPRERRGAQAIVVGALLLALAATVVVLDRTGGGPGAPLAGIASPQCAPVIYGGHGRVQSLIAVSTALQGAYSANGVQTTKALGLVLAQRGWRAGGRRIGLQVCDEATATSDFDATTCRKNARAFAGNRSVIAVIGPFLSGCTTELLPIVNRAPGGAIPVLGVSATYLGFTRDGPGVAAGDPDRYYPTGHRNFVRVVPADDVQGAAAALYLERAGAKRVFVLGDGSLYGDGVAGAFATAAKRIKLAVVGRSPWDTGAVDYRALAARARRARADAVYLGGAAEGNGPQLIRDLRAELPTARLIGPDGMNQADLLVPGAGAAAEGFMSTISVIHTTRLPVPGRAFATQFRRRYGEDPIYYSLNSAQAEEILLDAIAEGGASRARVTATLLGMTVKDGLVGDFTIDGFGDTSLTRTSVYRIRNGRNSYVTSVSPPTSLLARR